MFLLVMKLKKKWEDIFSNGYRNIGYKYLYSNHYKTIKDIKVSSVNTNMKEFYNWLNSGDGSQAMSRIMDITDFSKKWSEQTGAKLTYDLSIDFFKSLGLQGKNANDFYNYMKQKGYDAIADNYGIWSGGDLSAILLDPDNTIKLKSQRKKKL